MTGMGWHGKADGLHYLWGSFYFVVHYVDIINSQQDSYEITFL